MSARVFWDVSREDFEDDRELSRFVVESLNMVNPQGTRGITLWIGPIGAGRADMPLRLDLDSEPGAEPVTSVDAVAELPEITFDTVTGAAAARWLPDGLIAVEPGFPGCEIAVMEDSGQGLVSIAVELVQVSVPTAIRLALEFAESGTRPEGAEWRTPPRR